MEEKPKFRNMQVEDMNVTQTMAYVALIPVAWVAGMCAVSGALTVASKISKKFRSREQKALDALEEK